MSGYPTTLKEAQQKLGQLEAKLAEIDSLKLLEPKLRAQAAGLVAKIAEMEEASAANKSENTFFEKEVNEEAPATEEPTKTPPANVFRDAEGDRKAQLRAINKKLKQIDILKHKDNLDEDAQQKIALEPKLRKQVAALEKGESIVDSDEEEKKEAPKAPAKPAKNVEEVSEDADESTAASVKLPKDQAERSKRLKNLQKKLQQIAKLKEKGGVLDEEAKQKIASADRVNQEIAAIEEGKDEVIFVESTDADANHELDKKLKNVNKKLEQIAKLKNETNLDADAQAKVDNEASLKKEKGALEREIAEFNKAERRRVAERLGWEVEAAKKKKGQK